MIGIQSRTGSACFLLCLLISTAFGKDCCCDDDNESGSWWDYYSPVSTTLFILLNCINNDFQKTFSIKCRQGVRLSAMFVQHVQWATIERLFIFHLKKETPTCCVRVNTHRAHPILTTLTAHGHWGIFYRQTGNQLSQERHNIFW